MALTPTLVTGDDSILPVQLFKNDLTFNINSNATVKVSVITKDRKKILLAPILALETNPGSDWAISTIVARFSSVDTNSIPLIDLGSAILEIQVDDGGKLTWFVKLKIIQGTIDQ